MALDIIQYKYRTEAIEKMSIIKSIKSFLGMQEKLMFNDLGTNLIEQLQTNRENVLRQIIPTELMNEFMNIVYSDHHLKSIVKDIYHTFERYLVNEEARRVYLKYALRLSLSIRGFGRRLILHHNIDPEVVVHAMLGETEEESVGE